MATTESDLASKPEAPASGAPTVKVIAKKSDSVLDKALRLLSSVRFGIVMLSILLLCCMIGMFVMQVNVEGFQKYYTNLKPAQRTVYGALGFFDIYRSRYFTLLLAITGLNIILASIDRFPAAWQYIRKPKLAASPKFIAAQTFNAESVEHASPQQAAEKVRNAWRRLGFRGRVTEEGNRLTVFAQRNSWNRLGAYVVHVALLTIFIGGFLTSRYGVGGSMEIRPGAKPSNVFTTSEISLDGAREAQAFLPFQIECTDLQQLLIRPEGGLEQTNTIDWLSSIRIIDKDRNVQKDLLVHLNNVGDYRGYRFFQNSFQPVGNARQITITFEPAAGGGATIPPVTIMRNGSAEVPGIGTVRFVGFFADFDVDSSGPTTLSREYNNPAAQLEITGPDGKKTMAFAFNPKLADQYLTRAGDKLKEGDANPLLVNGNKIILRDFEKVSLVHILTIQYDPGRTPVYLGFVLLVIALCSVFFFSHQRAWAVIEPDAKGSKIYFGGSTNRNKPAFEGRFNSLVQSVTGGPKDE